MFPDEDTSVWIGWKKRKALQAIAGKSGTNDLGQRVEETPCSRHVVITDSSPVYEVRPCCRW